MSGQRVREGICFISNRTVRNICGAALDLAADRQCSGYTTFLFRKLLPLNQAFWVSSYTLSFNVASMVWQTRTSVPGNPVSVLPFLFPNPDKPGCEKFVLSADLRR
jgi:hypothetical protein